jgi:hypothetical protein
MTLTGAVVGLLALAAIGVGAAAMWLDGERNDKGYLTTDSQRFAAGTRALASDNLDVDMEGPDWFLDSSDLGDVQLQVRSERDKPVFVGIARTQDVATYLRGVDHTRVTDIEAVPFEASYLSEPGKRRPAAPAEQSFWAASTHGRGAQTLKWHMTEGDWSVVVMNADGSRGVAADVKAGAKISFLDELGWSALGGGAAGLVVALLLLWRGVRPPRNPAPHAEVAPAAVT